MNGLFGGAPQGGMFGQQQSPLMQMMGGGGGMNPQMMQMLQQLLMSGGAQQMPPAPPAAMGAPMGMPGQPMGQGQMGPLLQMLMQSGGMPR